MFETVKTRKCVFQRSGVISLETCLSFHAHTEGSYLYSGSVETKCQLSGEAAQCVEDHLKRLRKYFIIYLELDLKLAQVFARI